MMPSKTPALGLASAVVSFARFCREQGLNVGLQETQDALSVANEGFLQQRFFFKSALKTIFCHSPEERLRFEKLFLLFWRKDPVELQHKSPKKQAQHLAPNQQKTSLAMLGGQPLGDETTEVNETGGACDAEVLRKTDFSKLSEIASETLEQIAEKLYREMALRLRRRMKEGRKSGKINLRKTIRHSLGFGGEPMLLYRKTQRPKKQRLIVLLDVSGSMDRYSFYLLRFICALRENFRQLEAFVFSTSLIRITKAVQSSYLDDTLLLMANQADNWSGGTKIGACLNEFLEDYGKQLLNGGPVVVILSDGLEAGDANLLSASLRKIKARSRKVIWLNPLKGNPAYQPLAKGMSAALPFLDEFGSAHNLESLMELERLL